jgi:MFS family permease
MGEVNGEGSEQTDDKAKLKLRGTPSPVGEKARQMGREVRDRMPLLTGLTHLPDSIKRAIRNPQSELRTREGLSPEAALHATHNFRSGVLNGVMFTMVDGLIAPSLVLALFVKHLGGDNVLVGLLPSLVTGGWFLPQILVAGRVQGRTHMMDWYLRSGIVRIAILALLTVVTILLANMPLVLLVVFFFCYAVYSFAAGVSGIPWIEMVGKTIAPRRRGSFFGLRNFWGGLLALLVAAPVGLIVSEQFLGLTFPYNFALLFGATTVVVSLGVYFWVAVKEPAAIEVAPSLSIRKLLRRGMEAYRTDSDYRSFMISRILLSLATVSDPFYVVYAQAHLGAPAGTVGLYLAALSIASLLSNFIWSPLADRASNRTLMTLAVLVTALVPLIAILVSMFIGTWDNVFLYSSFTLVFIMSGLALGASRIVNNNMVLTVAPPAERATYVGFLNAILGVVIFVPVLGGLVVDVLGFLVIFVASLVLAALALLASTRMSTKRPFQ